MATVLTKEKQALGSIQSVVSESDSNIVSVAPLGVPSEEKRFFFQKTKTRYDPNATATLVCQPHVEPDVSFLTLPKA